MLKIQVLINLLKLLKTYKKLLLKSKIIGNI